MQGIGRAAQRPLQGRQRRTGPAETAATAHQFPASAREAHYEVFSPAAAVAKATFDFDGQRHLLQRVACQVSANRASDY